MLRIGFLIVLFMANCLDAQEIGAIHLIYVNNKNNLNGDGSFNNPYSSLKAAEVNSVPGDVIIVFAGDHTTNGMDEGIILKENQSLIGMGLPLITNNHGVGVELANNNEVSGIHFYETASWSIHGSSIANAWIFNNVISNPLNDGGIGIYDGSKSIQISNTHITNGQNLNNFGILLQNHGQTVLNTLVKANVITGFLEGIAISSYECSQVTSHVQFNDASNNISAGIDVSAYDSSQASTIIAGNSVHDNSENGIITFSGEFITLTPTKALLNSTLRYNSVLKNGLEGILVGAGNSGTQSVSVDQNRLMNNGGEAGVLVENLNYKYKGNSICLQLNNNDSNTGYFLRNTDDNTFNIMNFINNQGHIRASGSIEPVDSCNGA